MASSAKVGDFVLVAIQELDAQKPGSEHVRVEVEEDTRRQPRARDENVLQGQCQDGSDVSEVSVGHETKCDGGRGTG